MAYTGDEDTFPISENEECVCPAQICKASAQMMCQQETL